jgi:hypothetical protein
MTPEKWGPPMWKFLHVVTFTYPKNPSLITKKKYFSFIKDFKNVIPCQTCREGYVKAIKDFNIEILKNPETFSRWMVKVHNRVNKKLGKEFFPYSKALKMYT